MQNSKFLLLIIFLSFLSACQNAPTPTSSPSINDSGRIDPQVSDYYSIILFDEDLEASAATFRQMASQPAWVQGFITAQEYIENNNPDAAIGVLQSIADDETIEIGLRLLAWNGLRDLGLSPSDTSAQGFLLEMPSEVGLEFLLVYRDGRLRLLNGGGMGVGDIYLWESYDISHPLNQEAIQFLELAQGFFAFANPIRHHLETYPSEWRLTFLSFNGLYAVEPSLTNANQSFEDFLNQISAFLPEILETVTAEGIVLRAPR